MVSALRREQVKAAKRYCWEMYRHKSWFCGAVYRWNNKQIIGVDILVDPNNTDRFTFVAEHKGVPLRTVKWDPEQHGERYDKEHKR